MRVRITLGLSRTGDVGRMRSRDHARKALFGDRYVIGRGQGRGSSGGRRNGESRQSGEQDAA
jgi:hypothetical protein